MNITGGSSTQNRHLIVCNIFSLYMYTLRSERGLFIGERALASFLQMDQFLAEEVQHRARGACYDDRGAPLFSEVSQLGSLRPLPRT